MPKYLLLKRYHGGPEPHHPFPPMDPRRATNVAERDHLRGPSKASRSTASWAPLELPSVNAR
jgi:hypothetical protein